MTRMNTAPNLSDHLAIADTCTSMGWYADRHQWDELIPLFADEVLVDYTSLNGCAATQVRPDDLVAGWRTTLGALVAIQHLIPTPLVSVDGDSATCFANFQATHLGRVRGESTRWTPGVTTDSSSSADRWGGGSPSSP
jgi:hypothetical protein